MTATKSRKKKALSNHGALRCQGCRLITVESGIEITLRCHRVVRRFPEALKGRHA
jgi:hypothetical protein